MAEPNRSRVPVGTVLEGKFRITQEIGRGGMAAVFEAENVDIGKRVAVKLLADELLTSHIVRERFIREARAAAAIRSPYICEVYDTGMFEERPFLVMELLEGESLYDRMTRVRQMKLDVTLKIATQVARGLQKAHEMGIVHRDLKPENIFLTRDEDGELLAKIVDFGLAKFYEGQGEEQNVRLTREGALFGTPAYMSPEQAKGQGEVDHRADLWALGCIVYECVTGQTVWNVEQGVAMILAQIAGAPIPKPSKLRPDLPPAFDEWFERALDRDPARRYQSAKSLAEALGRVVGDEPSSARRPLQSEVEGSLVDALMDGRPLPQSPSMVANMVSGRVSPSPPIPVVAPQVEPSIPPPRRGAAAAGWLVLFSLLALGGYAAWLFLLHPASQGSHAETNASKPMASGSAAASNARPPAEASPFAAAVSDAQALLRDGRTEAAVAKLKQAQAIDGGKVVGQALLAHTEIALEKNQGPCRLVGIGRPRPFDVVDPASQPTLVSSAAGPLVAWSDSHQDVRRRASFVSVLDDALRRVSPTPINFTPEANSAVQPTLLRSDEGLAAIYWDSGGKEPGVYVRRLDADGRILSPARLISGSKKDKFFPTMTALPGGGYFAIWSEKKNRPSVSDLVGRRLDRNLNPVGDAVSLTAFAKGAATQAAASIYGGKLFVAFRYGPNELQSNIQLLRISLDAPELSTGIKPAKRDVFAGERINVHGFGKHSEPTLVCEKDGCFVAWDDETAGALAAFIAHDQKEPLWHRDFSSQALRPTLIAAEPGQAAGKAFTDAKAVVAYFADSRLRIAPITRDGVGTSSVVTRVSGFQPRPAIVPGKKPGDWVLAFRDYEAGHLELFVAQASCTEPQKP